MGAGWDFSSFNPYSCNNDDKAGPTFLSKYVRGSRQIPLCPAEQDLVKRVGSFAPENYWTGYWYPMSLVYTPKEVGTGNLSGPQTPQKLTSVRYPVQKVVIIDRKTWHNNRYIIDTDKAPNQFGGLTAANSQNAKLFYVVAGFADGHVESRPTSEMYRADVNWTGNNGLPPGPLGFEYGVLGKDFK